MHATPLISPGPIVLFGSGETSPSGRKVFDFVLRNLPTKPRLALLETPAGFELNSSQVIGRVADFLAHRLQNYEPQITVVPARKRGTAYSPDDPQIVEPLYSADLIFMGPGSPSYAVRQLQGSLAWQALLASHRLGAAVVFASAAAVAISRCSIPVYEIYKVGEDPHWKDGLDFFGRYGLPLVFVPHWNNTDGGEELDTSRCFMGRPRFAELMEVLPAGMTVMGIDEKTALVIDPQECVCRVIGLGGVTLLHNGPAHTNALPAEVLGDHGLQEVVDQRQAHVHSYKSGSIFALSRIGPFIDPESAADLPPEVWQQAMAARHMRRTPEEGPTPEDAPPAEVLSLVEARQAARESKDWAAADSLRLQIAGLGWQVLDTPEGARVVRGEG
jgi:cyanophycinase-like exopeptidase